MVPAGRVISQTPKSSFCIGCDSGDHWLKSPMRKAEHAAGAHSR